ncbi:MAG: 2-phospho-L-lactate guanylyltransferase [Acidobacteriota bacterium]|nr:2-phospho-L-lactate guanylyltransferase [Acidobacteriota bacterium]
MKVVLLPLKDPTQAKQRLAGQLSSSERQRLAWAMLEDVAQALHQAQEPDQVVVVSSYPPILRYARQHHWHVIPENSQISESRSVDRSCQLLRESDVTTVLRIPGDIPLLQGKDLDLLLQYDLSPPSAIIVPSRDGTGTNALLRNPPDAFPSHFGENSFILHQKEASHHGVKLKIISNPRISFDLDKLNDILSFIKIGKDTHTATVLKKFDSLKGLHAIE